MTKNLRVKLLSNLEKKILVIGDPILDIYKTVSPLVNLTNPITIDKNCRETLCRWLTTCLEYS